MKDTLSVYLKRLLLRPLDKVQGVARPQASKPVVTVESEKGRKGEKRGGKDRMFHFSKGNLKLSKDILIWNLPAIKTCPASSVECRKYCYALKAQKSYPSVLPSRERNLDFTKRKDFVTSIVTFLSKRKEGTIRWHESGDIYNKSYLENLKEIARRLPHKTFYAYTKSYFIEDFWKDIPENLILIQSVESAFPHLVKQEENTARVILHDEEVKSGEYLCTYGTEHELKCGSECRYCQTRGRGKIHVVFRQH